MSYGNGNCPSGLPDFYGFLKVFMSGQNRETQTMGYKTRFNQVKTYGANVLVIGSGAAGL